ncbi:MAG: Hint domain-containing protein [Candidatus Sumerlaeota bacterium]|nr:Hint domain-containing protein [Candidatus Sumerlaeota bacterium]
MQIFPAFESAIPGGASCRVDCFRAGTRVKTRLGWKAIEIIRRGERVWTHHGLLQLVMETRTFAHTGAMIGVRLEDSETTVWCTPEQKFLVSPPASATAFRSPKSGKKGEEWVAARDFWMGLRLTLDETGHRVRITALERAQCNETVYHLLVERDHSFITEIGVAYECEMESNSRRP